MTPFATRFNLCVRTKLDNFYEVCTTTTAGLEYGTRYYFSSISRQDHNDSLYFLNFYSPSEAKDFFNKNKEVIIKELNSSLHKSNQVEYFFIIQRDYTAIYNLN